MSRGRVPRALLPLAAAAGLYAAAATPTPAEPMPESRQITAAPDGHMLTNVAVWSPDSRWIVYDVRSSADGSTFDGTRIERVEVETGRVELLYESRDGACCGVVTTAPSDDRARSSGSTPAISCRPSRRALAFQGHVLTTAGTSIAEVFVADLPDDLAALATAGDGPLAGTATTRPSPPRGVSQRRLTFTADRRHPGLQGPRHWLRSSPDGTRIGCLMRDDAGVVQFFTVDPAGGPPRQVTRDAHGIASSFTWDPDGGPPWTRPWTADTIGWHGGGSHSSPAATAAAEPWAFVTHTLDSSCPTRCSRIASTRNSTTR